MTERKDPVESGTGHSHAEHGAEEAKGGEGMAGSPEERKRQRTDIVQDNTGDVASHQQTEDNRRKKKKGKAAKEKKRN